MQKCPPTSFCFLCLFLTCVFVFCWVFVLFFLTWSRCQGVNTYSKLKEITLVLELDSRRTFFARSKFFATNARKICAEVEIRKFAANPLRINLIYTGRIFRHDWSNQWSNGAKIIKHASQNLFFSTSFISPRFEIFFCTQVDPSFISPSVMRAAQGP